MIKKRAAFATLAVIAASAPAQSAVTISSAATQNMNCSGGTCMPTATDAVLNAGDLENYLSQFGNVRVMTTGSGVEANNIVVNAAVSSPDSTSLTLDAHGAITINAAVSIGSGTSELELQSGKGGPLGTLLFGRKGHITFGSLSDIFGINGGIFTLVGSVQGLASAVSANPSGAFALANSYDASQDGTYTSVPIPTPFTGTFEGLGNAISNLSIDDANDQLVGLFAEVDSGGTLRDIAILKADISAANGDGNVAPLAGYNAGTVSNAFASGQVTGPNGAGGLIGANIGTMSLTGASTRVDAMYAGGLATDTIGTIADSYAVGRISGTLDAGGLTAINEEGGTIENSYSSGTVVGVPGAYIGGFAGANSDSHISASYSTGKVRGSSRYMQGGFVGYDGNPGDISDSYWDTDTSHIHFRGAGNRKHDPGVTGLTTEQLQSGLPAGFDPKIWKEKSGVDNGLPYLINNPPPK